MSFENVTIRGRDCDAEIYHAANADRQRGAKDWVVSSGMLREGGHCWARWKAGYQPPESEAKDFGSLFDLLAFTPAQFERKYVVRPDTYTHAKDGVKDWNNNATVCKEWNAAAAAEGRKPIKKAELAEVQSAVRRLREDAILSAFIDQSAKQTWLQGEWKDEATGLFIPVQALVDLAPQSDSEFSSCLGDGKTTRSAAPHVWSKYSSQRGYHVQAAFYIDMWNAATGDLRDTFCHLLTENYPPWQTGRSMVSLQKLEFGRILYQAYLARYAKCLATGIWPDYQAADARAKEFGGWSLDEATKWDEAEAMRGMEQIANAPEPADDDDFPAQDDLGIVP